MKSARPSLQNLAVRLRFLNTLRACGQYEEAYKMCNLNPRSALAYRNKTPEFNLLCEQAKELFKVESVLKYGVTMKRAALKELQKRINDGTISDAALLKILGIGL